jgi:hypothetical protein
MKGQNKIADGNGSQKKAGVTILTSDKIGINQSDEKGPGNS